MALEAKNSRNDGAKEELPKDEKSMRKVRETKKINIGTVDDPNG